MANNALIGIRLLETLTSALYEDPIALFREYVQNSVDSFVANPIKGEFHIRIDVDKTNRNITFIDNGLGIPKRSFNKKMRSISLSDKSDDEIGFRGIGRLSGMPFCKTLIFHNKVRGSSEIQTFEWSGADYKKLLENKSNASLEKTIKEIAKSDKYSGSNEKSEEHYFKVELLSYSDEIARLVENDKNLLLRLGKILPVPYKKNFVEAETIHNYYKEVIGRKLQDYEFDITLNGNQIEKPYDKKNILESGIRFRNICIRTGENEDAVKPIGILWFTHNRKVTSNGKNQPRGIYVRSKNMLMGDEYAIATAVMKSKDLYAGTLRELTQTLNGVFGEVLLYAPRILFDNARRDWFRLDNNSAQLNSIMAEYLIDLKDYRYAASEAFNDLKSQEKREKLVKAFKQLNRVEVNNEGLFSLYSSQTEKIVTHLTLADEDIPNASSAKKKVYNELMDVIRKYYEIEKKDIEDYIKLRNYIRLKNRQQVIET